VNPACSFPGCDKPRPYAASDYCNGHLTQKKRGKELAPIRADKTRSLEESLLDLSEVDPETGCRLWTGVVHMGYGSLKRKGKKMRAHRVAYEVWVGPIDDALVAHHTCANRLCINPDHLQAVTQADNLAEMLERHNYQVEIIRLKAALQKCTCGAGEAA